MKTHLNNYRNSHNPKIKEGHKLKAANALKKKKMYENQISNLENSQFTLESMQMQTDMMKEQIHIMKVMHDSAQLQKGLMNTMSADTMWDIAQNMNDIRDEMEELNEVFTESYKVDVDEAELDAELDELEYNEKDNFNPVALNAPNKKLMSKKEMDEKQLEDELFS